MSETLLIHSLIHPPPPSNVPFFSLLIKLTSWAFFLGVLLSCRILIPSPPTLSINAFSEVRTQMGRVPPSPHPPASLNSVQEVAGVVWEGLTTGTHRSHSCSWSIANAGDTCMHCTIRCLCAMQITCGAGTSWNVE